MKTLKLTLFFLLLSSFCFSQQIIDKSDSKKPTWYSGNNNIDSKFFTYYRSQGTSNAIDTARKNAIQNVIVEYAQTLGTEYIVNSESSTSIINLQQNDSVKTTQSFVFTGKVKGKEQNFRIPCLTIVEYYWEKEMYNGKPQYQYWVLARIPNKERDCNMPIYQSYGKSAVWRSALLPGWGQMHLGYKTKGAILLTTTALFVSGVATSQIMYVNNWNDYTSSLTLGRTADAEVYKSNADNWFLVRNINLIALSGVYIYNLVDALTKKGVNIYTYNNSKVDLFPSICLNSAMLTLKIKI